MDNYFLDKSLTASYSISGRPFEQIVSRLDALMMVLKSCKGKECVEPWEVLHPKSGIKSLKDALNRDFDAFYADQPKVEYSACELGYIKSAEGPQHVNVFGGGVSPAHGHGHGDAGAGTYEDSTQRTFKYTGPWSVWT